MEHSVASSTASTASSDSAAASGAVESTAIATTTLVEEDCSISETAPANTPAVARAKSILFWGSDGNAEKYNDRRTSLADSRRGSALSMSRDRRGSAAVGGSFGNSEFKAKQASALVVLTAEKSDASLSMSRAHRQKLEVQRMRLRLEARAAAFSDTLKPYIATAAAPSTLHSLQPHLALTVGESSVRRGSNGELRSSIRQRSDLQWSQFKGK